MSNFPQGFPPQRGQVPHLSDGEELIILKPNNNNQQIKLEEYSSSEEEKLPKGIEWHHTKTCLSKLREVKAQWYFNFAKFSNNSIPKNILMRLVAPSIVLGLGSAIITLAFKVGAVAETALKAFGNILGGFFSSKCDIEGGIHQLIVELPKSIYELIISITIEIPIEGVATLVSMPICPFTFSVMRGNENMAQASEIDSPIEKNRYAEELEKKGFLKTLFNHAFGKECQIDSLKKPKTSQI